MKVKILISLTLLISSFSCARKHDKIEIYLVENVSSDHSDESDCRCCFDIDKAELSSSPLISAKDIMYFDWTQQRIELTKACRAKLSGLKIPMRGIPAVMTVNGKPIYELWFWNESSSFACERACTFPQFDFEIVFGFPERYKRGSDPRFNDELKASLIKLDLLK
jgi:hypothetical protein